MPKNLVTFDKKNAEYLDSFDQTGLNPNPEGGKAKKEEDDEDMPRGQKVQCAQQ